MSKCCWKNGADRLARCNAAETELQRELAGCFPNSQLREGHSEPGRRKPGVNSCCHASAPAPAATLALGLFLKLQPPPLACCFLQLNGFPSAPLGLYSTVPERPPVPPSKITPSPCAPQHLPLANIGNALLLPLGSGALEHEHWLMYWSMSTG